MKVLLATDGSRCSRAAIEEIIRRPWPADTEVRVLSVAHGLPVVPDPFFVGMAAHLQSLEEERKRAAEDAEWGRDEISRRAPGLVVSKQIAEGSTKAEIIDAAAEWGADLIVVGSHGRGTVGRFLLGSVSQSVVLHAPCSVEVVRCPESQA